MNRHLLSTGDLTRDDAELILNTAEELRSLADRPWVTAAETCECVMAHLAVGEDPGTLEDVNEPYLIVELDEADVERLAARADVVEGRFGTPGLPGPRVVLGPAQGAEGTGLRRGLAEGVGVPRALPRQGGHRRREPQRPDRRPRVRDPPEDRHPAFPAPADRPALRTDVGHILSVSVSISHAGLPLDGGGGTRCRGASRARVS